MIALLTRNLKRFYQISIFLMMMATLGGMFYFWKLGFIDGTRSENLHQASFIVERFQNEKPLKEIKSLAFSENTKQAIEKLEALEVEIEKINQISTYKDYDNLKESLQKTKTSVASLISYPKTTKVIVVFNDKMEKFHEFVSQNNWRTLTRVAERVLTLSQGYVNKSKLESFIQDVDKDLSYMDKVTENSILSRADKSEISSRIQNLSVETKMLLEYVQKRKAFYKVLNTLDEEYSNWMEEVSPELALQKLDAAQIGKAYVLVLLGLFGLSSILFVMSFIVNRMFTKKAQNSLEKEIEEYVTANLMIENNSDLNQYSEKFNDFTLQTSKYLNKRMSFGTIFQEALPLGSILLDKNLKVIWANKFFCDEWEVEEDEINKGFVSWDYLCQMTNLGNNDPVLEALKFNVAGIFQIQVKTEGRKEAMPFEMFVSPVKNQRENKVMLFFYPLVSLQQTISDQARSIVSPIFKTLDLMLKNQFNDDVKNDLRRDFEIGGVLDILNSLTDLDYNIKRDREVLLDEIENNYAQIEGLQENLEKMKMAQVEFEANNRSIVRDLSQIKELIIELSSAGKGFESLQRDLVQLYDETVEKYQACFQKNMGLVHLSQDISQALPHFEAIKEDFKILKSEVSESRGKLSQSLVQLVHLKKKLEDNELKEKFSHYLIRINEDFKNLDVATTAMDKKLLNLEVILSKAQMLISGMAPKVEEYNSYDDKEYIAITQRRLDGFVNHKFTSIEKVEDEVVEKMMAIYGSTKSNLHIVKELSLQEMPKHEMNASIEHNHLSN